MEESKGFGEFITNDNKRFFNLGPKNNWETLLERKTADEIEDKFKNEMKELGYI